MSLSKSNGYKETLTHLFSHREGEYLNTVFTHTTPEPRNFNLCPCTLENGAATDNDTIVVIVPISLLHNLFEVQLKILKTKKYV